VIAGAVGEVCAAAATVRAATPTNTVAMAKYMVTSADRKGLTSNHM
jgi:hypothetical protein